MVLGDCRGGGTCIPCTVRYSPLQDGVSCCGFRLYRVAVHCESSYNCSDKHGRNHSYGAEYGGNGNPRGISFSRDGQVFKGSEVERKLSCGNIQKFYRACSQHLGQGRTVQMQVTSQMRQSQVGKGEAVARKICGVVGVILEGCLTDRPSKEMSHKLRYFDIDPIKSRQYDIYGIHRFKPFSITKHIPTHSASSGDFFC